jgi:CTP:molybdopterin cytidylyltransferase MocA
MVGAVLLTAGKSERMGGRPKALLRFKGRTFLEHVLTAIEKAGITDVAVVAGHHREEISKAFPLFSLVFNPHYEQGMGTSVQAGIRALPAGLEGAGIFLVDQPMIDPETIVSLSSQIRPGRIVLPICNERPGHPVFFASDIFREILGLSQDQGLDVVVRRDPARITPVHVTNSGVLKDIDTPEQFSNLLREHE